MHTRALYTQFTIDQIPYHAIKIEDGEKAYPVYLGTLTTAGGAVSVLSGNTAAVYEATSGAATIILIIQGSNTTTLTDFEIFQGDVNAGTETQLEDFPSVSMALSSLVTSKALTLASGKHFTI